MPNEPAPEELARMREWLEADSPPALESLEALPEPLALALAEGAVQHRRVGLAEALARSARKPVAKAAKRALYQLRSLGCVGAEPLPLESAPPAKPPPEAQVPCLLSTMTGNGERALLVARPVQGGLEVAQLVFSDELGAVHLESHAVSRGAYRRQLKEIRAGRAAPAIEIPLERARELLSAAAGANLRSRTPFPEGFDSLLRHAGAEPAEATFRIPPAEPEDERIAAQAQRLHDEPEIQAWLPPEPELRALGEKMEQLVHSPLKLSEAQRREQQAQLFRTAADGFFTAEKRDLYARRLWSMAEFFERTQRPEPARLARAEARRLAHLAPGQPSRFAEFLFEKVLLLTQRAAGGQPPQTPAVASEKTSPGGLILP